MGNSFVIQRATEEISIKDSEETYQDFFDTNALRENNIQIKVWDIIQ
jgi:hypothetical protein